MTERIIVVDDIHGCSAALRAVIEAIDPTPLDTIVFLGDYIDRGPDSRGVIEQVIALEQRCIVAPLMGNHEEMLLAALEGKDNLRYWLKFGGMDALASYGYTGEEKGRLEAVQGQACQAGELGDHPADHAARRRNHRDC